MHRLVVKMNDGIAVRRGCWRPRPPLDRESVAMVWAWFGSEWMPRISHMKESSIVVKLELMSLVQLNHSCGRSSSFAEMTSLLKR